MNYKCALQGHLWERFPLPSIPDDRIYHNYPTFGREHVTDRRDQCWCQPSVEFINDGAIIIHKVEQ